MKGKTGRPRPPASARFQKGRSGNPKGRPKAAPRLSVSAFDVVIDRTLTVTQNGKPREVTIEEALQHRTYQDAVAGSRAARREVLKMIAMREKWLAAKGANRQLVRLPVERTDPDNAEEALLLLGIAEPDSRWDDEDLPDGDRRLLLRPWAVQRALSRGRRRLSAENISDIERCTRDASTLRWPAGAKHEPDE
jgi:hypothetical protein